MKTKFVVICNNISGDKLVTDFDDSLLHHFQHDEIEVQKVRLVDLVGIGKMPSCLSDWAKHDKVVIICNSATAAFFLDVHKVIENAELWAINWPKKIASTDNPERHKFFEYMPQMTVEAKRLMAA
ncbi:MAG: hypothetical protein AAB504_01000 [Patescibacteria group bacterium]